jgi:hypothetical protein
MKINKSVQCCLLIIVIALSQSCLGPSRDEVTREMSPSGNVEAVLIETNGGATTSFGYQVYVVSKGGRPGTGIQVATLYGAVRNYSAYGVNLKWDGAEKLFLEYLKADSARLLQEQATIKGEQIHVALREGVNDPDAPAGGMLYNLQKKR